MARPKSKKPAYCLHKPSRRAFVKLNGQRVYLGRHGSQEKKDECDRVVGEWIARGRQLPPSPAASDGSANPTSITVLEVSAAFWTANEQFYLNADKSPTSAHGHYRAAISPHQWSPLECFRGRFFVLGWSGDASGKGLVAGFACATRPCVHARPQ
jgi:hypothetical protein